MRTRRCNYLVLLQCRREAVKCATWGVRSQDLNLKELAGEHHKGWMLRFNWTQRREPHLERRQYEAQTEDLSRQAEKCCMASVSSCREVSS